MTLDTNFWKKYFIVYDTLNELTPYRDLLVAIADSFPLKKGEHVFDAGSGTGNLSCILEERGAKVTAMDYSEEGVTLHRTKSTQTSTAILNGDLTKPLPFQDNSFEYISMNNVLYTLPEDSRLQLMREFVRVLRPGGIIALANISPGFSPAKIYISHLSSSVKTNGILSTAIKIFHLFTPTIKIFYYNNLISRAQTVGAYHFLDEESQRALLADAGFTVLSEKRVYANQAILTVAQVLHAK